MTTRNFFIYQSIANLTFGIGLLLAPQMMVDAFGGQKTEITGTLEIVARGYGSLLMSLGIAAYLMRKAKFSLAMYAFLVASFVAAILVIIIHVRAILRGDENSLGWLTVLLIGIIAAWSGMLISKEKRATLE
jgi:hypothetical protein